MRASSATASSCWVWRVALAEHDTQILDASDVHAPNGDAPPADAPGVDAPDVDTPDLDTGTGEVRP